MVSTRSKARDAANARAIQKAVAAINAGGNRALRRLLGVEPRSRTPSRASTPAVGTPPPPTPRAPRTPERGAAGAVNWRRVNGRLLRPGTAAGPDGRLRVTGLPPPARPVDWSRVDPRLRRKR